MEWMEKGGYLSSRGIVDLVASNAKRVLVDRNHLRVGDDQLLLVICRDTHPRTPITDKMGTVRAIAQKGKLASKYTRGCFVW